MIIFEQKKGRTMDEKYTWDLTEFYKTDEEFYADIDKIKELVEKVKRFRGTFKDDLSNVAACFRELEELDRIFEIVSSYASFGYHQDMSDTSRLKKYKMVESLATTFSEATSYISPELSKLDDSVLEELANREDMTEYKLEIKDIIKFKKHILSEEVEEVVAKFSEVFGTPENVFDLLTNTEFKYENVKDSSGKEYEMNEALYSIYIKSNDEELRRNAFQVLFNKYKSHINSITELYLSIVKESSISCKLRHYESSLDAATQGDDSNINVYNTLVREVNKNLSLNHEYLALKAKMLGKDKVHMYDVYTNTLVPEDDKVEYEDAKEIVKKALSVLGDDYVEQLQYAFDHRWIDVYKTENKMSGGYSAGVHPMHPFILLNYVNSSRDVSTLAHELGHTMHSFYSNNAQNIFNANYTIMVAEVASTVNEILLANYQIEHEEDKMKKAALINEQLDMIRATLIRQTMFAEFEEIIHDKVSKGESLTSDNLCDEYYELVKKYFGNPTICDEEIKYEWARIPHFYRCFYVYKYATGITSAIVIASNILAHKEGYVEKYKHMLSLGRTLESLDLLRLVDVDLEKEETYEKAFDYYRENLRKLEELLNS